MQGAVEGGGQGRAPRRGQVPHCHTKSNYSKPPREFSLIEKSLILPFSATELTNKGPVLLMG